MTTNPIPDLDARARQFAHFARHDCTDDILYVRLSEAVAERPARAAALDAAPPTQARPVLWLASIHDRLLELDALGQRPALARYFGSLDGTRSPDLDLVPALDEFLAREDAALRERTSVRTTQTNEVGRCAVIAPLLADVARRAGGRPLALLDLGCSAGLNLGVDRVVSRYAEPSGRTRLAGPQSPSTHDVEPPILDCLLAGGTPPEGPWRLATRLGVDLFPVDVDDEAAVRWLRACLWPGNAGRRERFEAALRLARLEHWPVRATRDAAAAVDAWLEGILPGVLPVVVNSWVLSYFDEAAFARIASRLLEHVAAGRLAWISGEMASVMRPAWAAIPAPSPEEERAAAAAGVPARDLAEATAWTVAEPAAGAAGVAWRLAARSHGHGRWAQFLGD